MPVVRWDPFQDVASLQERLYRVFGSSERGWMPAVDVDELPDAIVLKAELAGMRPEDVHIELDDDVLTIRGERRQEEHHGEGQHQSTEWHYGAFQRSITLPRSAKRDEIEASYENGVLEVRVPKGEVSKPRQIELTVKGGQSTLQTEQAA